MPQEPRFLPGGAPGSDSEFCFPHSGSARHALRSFLPRREAEATHRMRGRCSRREGITSAARPRVTASARSSRARRLDAGALARQRTRSGPPVRGKPTARSERALVQRRGIAATAVRPAQGHRNPRARSAALTGDVSEDQDADRARPTRSLRSPHLLLCRARRSQVISILSTVTS